MDEDYETVTVTIRMEVKPGADLEPIATAMVNAAESMANVLAAWWDA